jgi:hypothetical protein
MRFLRRSFFRGCGVREMGRGSTQGTGTVGMGLDATLKRLFFVIIDKVSIEASEEKLKIGKT